MSVLEVLDPATAEPIGSIEDMSEAHVSRAVARARGCRVAPLQAPWDGFKESGVGRELASPGLADYPCGVSQT